MRKLSVFFFALILVTSTVGLGNAAPITFSNRATWEAAIGAAPDVFVDFNGFSVDTSYAAAPLDLGPFSMSMTGAASRHVVDVAPFLFAGTDVDGTPYASAFVDDTRTVSITFDTAVNAWGFDIFAAGNVGNALFMDLETTSGIQTVSLLQTTSTTFFGVNMDPTDAISSITFRNGVNDGFSLDNVAASSVPEPSTALLLGLGLVGIAAGRRRTGL